jgi:hypothetical protein
VRVLLVTDVEEEGTSVAVGLPKEKKLSISVKLTSSLKLTNKIFLNYNTSGTALLLSNFFSANSHIHLNLKLIN